MGIEAGAQLEESRNASIDRQIARCGTQDARDDAKQRALPGAIFSNDSQAATPLHLEIDVLNGPEWFVVLPLPKREQLLQMI